MLPAYIFSKRRPQPAVMYASARGRLCRVAQIIADDRLFNWGDDGDDPASTVYTAECVLMDYFSRWPNARGPAGDCTPGINSLYELNGRAVVNGTIDEVAPFDSDDIS